MCYVLPKYLFSRDILLTFSHYDDVIRSTIASQIISLTIVYSPVYSGVNQRKYQSSASQAFVRGIYRWPANSAHKGPVTQKMFPFDDVFLLILYPPPPCLFMFIKLSIKHFRILLQLLPPHETTKDWLQQSNNHNWNPLNNCSNYIYCHHWSSHNFREQVFTMECNSISCLNVRLNKWLHISIQFASHSLAFYIFVYHFKSYYH